MHFYSAKYLFFKVRKKKHLRKTRKTFGTSSPQM